MHLSDWVGGQQMTGQAAARWRRAGVADWQSPSVAKHPQLVEVMGVHKMAAEAPAVIVGGAAHHGGFDSRLVGGTTGANCDEPANRECLFDLQSKAGRRVIEDLAGKLPGRRGRVGQDDRDGRRWASRKQPFVMLRCHHNYCMGFLTHHSAV